MICTTFEPRMDTYAVLRERGKLGSQFDCTAVPCEMRAERAFKAIPLGLCYIAHKSGAGR